MGKELRDSKHKYMNDPKYMEMLDLLAKAEMAARNGQWGTCHTACKNAGDVALEWHKEWKEKRNDRRK